LKTSEVVQTTIFNIQTSGALEYPFLYPEVRVTLNRRQHALAGRANMTCLCQTRMYVTFDRLIFVTLILTYCNCSKAYRTTRWQTNSRSVKSQTG